MNKYVILGLSVVVIVLGVVVFAFNPNSKSGSNNVLGTAAAFSRLTPNEFNQAVNSEGYKLIDIRTADEFSGGHLKNASQIDYYQTQAFSSYLDSLNKNDKYLIYCRSGNRSGKALELMKAKGFTNVSDLLGGYSAWISANLSIER